jgi:hypothetical protein
MVVAETKKISIHLVNQSAFAGVMMDTEKEWQGVREELRRVIEWRI